MSTAQPKTRSLFLVTVVIEAGTGLALMGVPSLLATLLLGSSLVGPVALTVGRVAGVALLALGVAAWLARDDGPSRAATGLVRAMTLYNAAIGMVLAYGGVGLGLSGIGLWPTVLLHLAMTVWCVMCVLGRPAQTIGSKQ